jgi:hypothetical protein
MMDGGIMLAMVAVVSSLCALICVMNGLRPITTTMTTILIGVAAPCGIAAWLMREHLRSEIDTASYQKLAEARRRDRRVRPAVDAAMADHRISVAEALPIAETIGRLALIDARGSAEGGSIPTCIVPDATSSTE